MSGFVVAGARTRVAVVAVVGIAAAGCGMDQPIYANKDTHRLGSEATKARAWAPTDSEPVTLDMDIAPTVKRGGQLPIRLRLHNGSDRAIVIGYNQRQAFDVLIATPGTNADSTAVWSPMKGTYGFGRGATTTDPLLAGRDTTFDVVWPVQDDRGQSVPPGRYRVRATVAAELLSTRQIWTPWAAVTVTP